MVVLQDEPRWVNQFPPVSPPPYHTTHHVCPSQTKGEGTAVMEEEWRKIHSIRRTFLGWKPFLLPTSAKAVQWKSPFLQPRKGHHSLLCQLSNVSIQDTHTLHTLMQMDVTTKLLKSISNVECCDRHSHK